MASLFQGENLQKSGLAMLVMVLSYVSMLNRTEPAVAGIKFANSVRVDNKKLELQGVGVRTKVVVNVYSAGFYAEQGPIDRATKPYAGKPGAKLAGDAGFFKAIQALGSAKAVLLTFARAVGADKVAEALSAVPGANAKSQQELHKCITRNGDLSKGDQLLFSWSKATDSVAVKSKSETLCTIKDADLAKGLLSMYLGGNAVSPKLKAAIASTIANRMSVAPS